jgi:hypothetical protein
MIRNALLFSADEFTKFGCTSEKVCTELNELIEESITDNSGDVIPQLKEDMIKHPELYLSEETLSELEKHDVI